MINIVVSGARGKMGSRIASLVLAEPGMKLVGAIETLEHLSKRSVYHLKGQDFLGMPVNVPLTSDEHLRDVLDKADVLIEFTNPEASLAHLELCIDKGKGMVIGTTGFKDGHLSKIKEISSSIPVFISPNMSLGVNLLFDIVGRVAKVLQDEYDIEIIEVHHHHKKDALSGTAIKLGEIIAASLGQQLKDIAIYGCRGLVGERSKGKIGFSVVRAGDIIGEHTILFAGEGERIEITHRVHSCDTFARGAVEAAKFLATKSSGLYDMRDVLGIR